MQTLVGLISEILDHSCGSLSDTPGTAGNGQSETERYNGGFQEYVIETHCVGFKVNARRTGDRWEIRDWTMYDC